ncbi:MAG TPA: hypothetical protein EYG19_07395, partial [Verrucomicrobia bacterium]|nr:hypothetical protein [Verrucomicrobiota bacterium]
AGAIGGVFTLVGHGLSDGDVIRLNPSDNADNAVVPAITGATDYYVKVGSADTFTIHPTAADATAGTNQVAPTGGGLVDFVDHATRVNITTAAESELALDKVKDAISRVAQDRAALGAVQSRLNFTNEQLSVTKENLSSAISRIADVDVAEEATQYARYQILVQSGTQMLTQANQLPNAALQLLRG